jgi:hypothetical protein
MTILVLLLILFCLFENVSCDCSVLRGNDVVVRGSSSGPTFVAVAGLTMADSRKAFLRVSQHATSDVAPADQLLVKSKLVFETGRIGQCDLASKETKNSFSQFFISSHVDHYYVGIEFSAYSQTTTVITCVWSIIKVCICVFN